MNFYAFSEYFGDLGEYFASFWSHFGDLGEYFGDLGGSWEQVGILMDFGSIFGHQKVQQRKVAAGGGTPMKLHPTGSAPASASEIRSRRGCGMRACLTQTLPSGMRARPDLKASPLPAAPCQIQAVG